MLLVGPLTCLTFYWCGDLAGLSLQRLLFGLWVIAIYPRLVTSDYPRHDGWVILSLLKEIPADFDTVLFPFRGEKPGHEISSGSMHVESGHEDCLN